MISNERKIKLLKITPEFLVDLFQNESPITLSFEGVPSDARIVGINVNTEYRQFELAIESESFPACELFRPLESLQLSVRRHTPAVEKI